MEKTTMGLIAALGALAATPAAANVNPATPATQSVLKPATVAELLDPIPDAADILQQLRAQDTLAPVEGADTQVAYHHHHHHHHHHMMRRHHHHHHHHWRMFRHHHHHHHFF